MSKPWKAGTPVDQIMSTDVISIGDDANLADAEKLIKEKNVDKLVVLHGKDVKGLLEDWRILPADVEKKVGDVQLSQLSTARSGSDVADVMSQLRNFPAVVVLRPNHDIAGVVTARDLLKVKRPWTTMSGSQIP